MGDEVSVLDFWVSPFGMTVRIALEMKGVKYEYKEEDLQNKSDLLIEMNPVHRKIPVLIHNGNPIPESLIAVQYINEVWPHKSPLLPSHPYHRAQARFWADFINQKIHVLGRKIWRTKGEEKEEAKKEFIKSLKILEKELGDKECFGGESLGYVDIALIPNYSWFSVYESEGNFSTKAEFPKLIEWCTRCLQNESVSKILPSQNKVHAFMLDFKKRFRI